MAGLQADVFVGVNANVSSAFHAGCLQDHRISIAKSGRTRSGVIVSSRKAQLFILFEQFKCIESRIT